MRKLVYLIVLFQVLLLTACNVHEWPELPELVQFNLRLRYETDMTQWQYIYDGQTITDKGFGATYDNHLSYGKIRYIVRAYPVSDLQRSAKNFTKEFVFTKDISEGYDHEVALELPAGSYNIMVWSDLIVASGDNYFYDATNFSEIVIAGEHRGNNDHRDAFRGTNSILLVTGYVEKEPATLDITMQRPMAKYEFVTTDLQEFIDKEFEYLQKLEATKGNEPPTRINIDDYIVLVYYSGYMPCAYDMNIDKPVDSKVGVSFESKLDVQGENEASLCFDYIFMNGAKAPVTVQIGLYDKGGRQVALSDPINVPLQRNHHTILKGAFLTQQASGGIVINPDFDGNHNILID